jgi:hypothetical protein
VCGAIQAPPMSSGLNNVPIKKKVRKTILWYVFNDLGKVSLFKRITTFQKKKKKKMSYVGGHTYHDRHQGDSGA